jgi:hypothetical protein
MPADCLLWQVSVRYLGWAAPLKPPARIETVCAHTIPMKEAGLKAQGSALEALTLNAVLLTSSPAPGGHLLRQWPRPMPWLVVLGKEGGHCHGAALSDVQSK